MPYCSCSRRSLQTWRCIYFSPTMQMILYVLDLFNSFLAAIECLCYGEEFFPKNALNHNWPSINSIIIIEHWATLPHCHIDCEPNKPNGANFYIYLWPHIDFNLVLCVCWFMWNDNIDYQISIMVEVSIYYYVLVIGLSLRPVGGRRSVVIGCSSRACCSCCRLLFCFSCWWFMSQVISFIHFSFNFIPNLLLFY